MVVVVPSAAVPEAIAGLEASGQAAWLVGEVAAAEELGGRYVEAPLEPAVASEAVDARGTGPG